MVKSVTGSKISKQNVEHSIRMDFYCDKGLWSCSEIQDSVPVYSKQTPE